MRSIDNGLLTALLALGVFVAGVVWALDDLKAWIGPHLQRLLPVHTSALGECNPPVEGEQLIIFVSKRGGKVSVESCMFVGSRGTYSPQRKGPAP